MDLFPDAKAPKNPNFNPADEYQQKKGSWLRTLPLMNESAIDFADLTYRSRAQSLQGVDEIINDVVQMLEKKSIIDNTYSTIYVPNLPSFRPVQNLVVSNHAPCIVVYTSDNGYHIGQNRAPAGKALSYAEDTNLPFAVRGPGIPKGAKSNQPSTHVDLAPTFLEITGLDKQKYPAFLDGTSLLDQWHNPLNRTRQELDRGAARETLNIEFWGLCTVEAPSMKAVGAPFLNNTYKSVRILGENNGWLFTKWCTGDTELYHTSTDKWELDNIAESEDPEHQRALTRLNAILMVTKSCEGGSCRDPWAVFELPHGKKLASFEEAMSPEYDSFFNGFPLVSFRECLQFQSAENEAPFYPPLPDDGRYGLGRSHRHSTDNFVETNDTLSITDDGFYGTEEQRHAKLEDLYKEARELTDEELGMDSAIIGKRWAATKEIDMRVYGYD